VVQRQSAFEAFIAIRDDAATAKLSKLGSCLQDIEDHLPVDPKYRNPRLGSMAPIRVVNEYWRPATATTACKRPPSTFRTTSA